MFIVYVKPESPNHKKMAFNTAKNMYIQLELDKLV